MVEDVDVSTTPAAARVRWRRGDVITAAVMLAVAALAAGFTWASGQDSYRLAALNNLDGHSSRWDSVEFLDSIAIVILIVGVLCLVALVMILPVWEALLAAGALISFGFALGTLVFLPLWTPPQAEGFAPPRNASEAAEVWDAHAWALYREPLTVPLIWGAAAVVLLIVLLATRAIVKRVKFTIAGSEIAHA